MEVGQLWVKLGLDKSNLDKGLNEGQSQVKGFGDYVKDAFKFTLGAGMFDLLKSGIKSAWDMSIGYNSSMQQNRISFEVLTKSGETAGKMMKDLGKMAADTPFELPQLTSAAKTLLAFGFNAKQATDLIKPLGDVAASSGERSGEALGAMAQIFGQIHTAGKLTTEDLKQMTNWGVGAFDIIAKQMGVTTARAQEMVTKGLIPADKGIQMLVKGMGDNFGGMMDKQSKSFQGLMSTLRDNVSSTLGGILEPAFNKLSNVVLPALISAVSLFGSTFQATGSVAESVAVIFDTYLGKQAGDAVIFLRDLIVNAFTWITTNGELVKGVVIAITAAFTGYKLAVMASIATQEIHNALLIASTLRTEGLAAAKTALAGAEGGVTVATRLLNAAMAANPLGLVIVLVTTLAGVFIYLWNTNEGFRNAVIKAWSSIRNAANDLWNGIKSAFNSVSDLVKSAYTWGSDIVDGIANGIKSAIRKVTNAVINIADEIRKYLHFSVPDAGPLREYMQWPKDFVEGYAGGIDAARGRLVDSIQGLSTGMALNVKANIGQGSQVSNQSSGGMTLHIENFNNNTKQDIENLAVELAQYLHMRERTGGLANVM